MSVSERKLTHQKIVLIFLAITALAIGIYARFSDLGKWPLAVDEYYIAKSVQNIIDTGLPQFKTGGYYTRGILYQYIAVPFVYAFENDEFWLRLIAALGNLAAIPAVFLIGRRIWGITGGSLFVILFSLSLWEIEFSRFARMYTMFQTVFVWYTYLFIRVVEEERTDLKYTLYLLSLASIMIYEGAIFLVMMNFFMLFLIPRHRTKTDLGLSFAISLLAYLYQKIDFRHLNEGPALPENFMVMSKASGPLHVPQILLGQLSEYPYGIIIFGFITVCGVLTAIRIFRQNGLKQQYKILLAGNLVLAALNLFGLIILINFMYVVINPETIKKIDRKTVFLSFSAVAVFMVFWLVWIFLHTDGTVVTAVKDAFKYLFNYPNLYFNVAEPWTETLPYLSLVLVVLTICGLSYHLFKSPDTVYQVIMGIVLINLGIIGIIRLPWSTTRYTFYLYPLFMIIALSFGKNVFGILSSANKHAGMKKIAAIAFVPALFFCSEDFSFRHIANIDSAAYNFRKTHDIKLAQHYYYRYDHRTPSEFVNANFNIQDKIITTIIPSGYYLMRIDYVYCDKDVKKFRAIAAKTGTVERWSNATLIYEMDKIFELIEANKKNGNRTWIMLRSKKYNWQDDLEKTITTKFASNKVFTSVDELVEVFSF